MRNDERTKTGLLAGEVIHRRDAERLILEGMERMGKRTEGLTRQEIIVLIRQVISWGIEILEKKEHTKSFAEVGWESIKTRKHCRPSTQRDLRYCMRRMLKLTWVGELPLRAMTTSDCRRILQEAFGHSTSLYIKGRAMLSSIFSYGIKHELCDTNPVNRIDIPKVQEKVKKPLSLQEIERLENAVRLPEHKDMRFSLHLMLYCGVRPTEVSRLTENDIIWEEQQILIRSSASKTGGGRIVPIRGIEKWEKHECCIPKNWMKRWKALRQTAGFTHNWIPDVCRHTFASYHAAFYRNLPQLQLEMGHRDVSLLWNRYMTPVLYKDAKLFWQKGDYCTQWFKRQNDED